LPLLGPLSFMCHQKWDSAIKIGKIPEKTPMLMLSGLQDEIVPASQMIELKKLAGEKRVQWIEFENGNHSKQPCSYSIPNGTERFSSSRRNISTTWVLGSDFGVYEAILKISTIHYTSVLVGYIMLIYSIIGICPAKYTDAPSIHRGLIHKPIYVEDKSSYCQNATSVNQTLNTINPGKLTFMVICCKKPIKHRMKNVVRATRDIGIQNAQLQDYRRWESIHKLSYRYLLLRCLILVKIFEIHILDHLLHDDASVVPNIVSSPEQHNPSRGESDLCCAVYVFISASANPPGVQSQHSNADHTYEQERTLHIQRSFDGRAHVCHFAAHEKGESVFAFDADPFVLFLV
jgi:hypothetical protein